MNREQMRIGIDARPIQGRFTGDRTYWRGLIQGLSRLAADSEFVIYLDAGLPKPKIPVSEFLRVRVLRAMNWRLWSVWSFPRALRSDGVQVAHVQYAIPPRMPCPAVTTIHDISFKRFPEFFQAKDRLLLDLAVRRAGRQAARIIAPSEHAKSEIVNLYGVNPDKITVTYEGVDEQFKPIDRDAAQGIVSENYGIRSPFVLTVGVIQPRKNLHRLLEGFAKLKGMRQLDHKLVVVGKYGWGERDLERGIEELGLGDEVVLTGYVSDKDLPAFYNAADLFVYPSIYEGFGLPPLEAMACGTPVITGNRSSLPEVVGEAGIMADPYDSDSFANAMLKVLSSEPLRADMSARGLDQAAKFSWDEMARQTAAVYHEVGRDK